MKAEIITIGDEILIGHTIDTNSAQIAQELNSIGIPVQQITSVKDEENQIIDSLKNAEKRSQIIIITGGLGPTNDDITKTTLAKYFNTKLVFNENVLENIKHLFRNRSITINEQNKKQAEVPANCKVLANKSGTAPGMLFQNNNRTIISLPGVPYEMKDLMTLEVIPFLRSTYQLGHVIHKFVMVAGTFEAFLAEKLKEYEYQLHKEVKLAYLPSQGIIKLRFSANGIDKKLLNNLIDSEIKKLKRIIPEYIFAFENTTLEKVLGNLLMAQDATLATAESCTGGNISKMITSVPGSSKYFLGSVIAYSNTVKEKILKVDSNLINKYGAVSKEVVEAMASGVQAIYKSTYSIATSGIAGPDGGSDNKPVGTTWIAIAYPGGIYSEKFNFGDHRERNILKASITALNMLRKKILNK